MVIKPKIRGFICTTAHPEGCAENVRRQIEYVKRHPIENGPKRVLVIGASSGYGLASRITAAFGSGAATIGVFFERPGTEKKPATAGWYNTAAFDRYAREAGLYTKNFNGDAFSHEAKRKVIDAIKQDMGQVDLVIYSLAAPVRKMPDTGEVVRSALKPIGSPFRANAIDTNRDTVISAEIEPASEEEIESTVKVMGGQDWELWLSALDQAGVLADGCQTTAYSYIGTDITWPIYWHGTLGRAKQDLERAAHAINARMREKGGRAVVSMLKSVVTQASSAIPMMPLYLSIVMNVMRKQGLHEGCVEQIDRLFSTGLYGQDAVVDEQGRIRMDDWELRDDVQETCRQLWPQVTSENLFELTDYALYKEEFMKLFGFGFENVDYSADVDPRVEFDVIDI